jgi:DNA-binding MarR family transcriptional regulator
MKAGLHRAFQSEGFNVTPEQWTVLSSLWEAEGVHQSLLAEKTLKDRHNITRILNLLERAGLVRRETDRGDLRRQRVYLTEAGKALKPELVRIAIDFLQKALAGMSQEDLNSMQRILGQVLDNLDSDSKFALPAHLVRPERERTAQQSTER